MPWQLSYTPGRSTLLAAAGSALVVLDPELPASLAYQVHRGLSAVQSAADLQGLMSGLAAQVRAGVVHPPSGDPWLSLSGAITAIADGRPVTLAGHLPGGGGEFPLERLELLAGNAGHCDRWGVALHSPDDRQADLDRSRSQHLLQWLPLSSGVVLCDAVLLVLVPAAVPDDASGDPCSPSLATWSAGRKVPAEPLLATGTDAVPASGLIGSAGFPVFRNRVTTTDPTNISPATKPDAAETATEPFPQDQPVSLDRDADRSRAWDPDQSDRTLLRRTAALPDRVAPPGYGPLGPSASSGLGPIVRAIICPLGHPNPPEAYDCRNCGQDLATNPVVRIPRPTVGILRLVGQQPDSPNVIPVDRELVLGSDPNGTDDVARFIRVGTGASGVSGRHLRIYLEGWHMLIADLGSRNGTRIEVPGIAASLIGTRHSTLITLGTKIILAPAIVYQYQVPQ